MTKSIKRNKTFKSKKKIKGGANTPYGDNYKVFQTTIKPVTQVEEEEEVEDEIYNLLITLGETECTKNNSIILNSEDVNYLLTYINKKKKIEKTPFQKYLEQTLQTINQECRYVLDLANTTISPQSNIYIPDSNLSNIPIPIEFQN